MKLLRDSIAERDDLEGVTLHTAVVRPRLRATSSSGPVLRTDADFLAVSVPFNVHSIDVPFPEDILFSCSRACVNVAFDLARVLSLCLAGRSRVDEPRTLSVPWVRVPP